MKYLVLLALIVCAQSANMCEDIVGHYDSHYKKAYQVRRIIFDEFKAAFEDVDVVLLPTSPTTAFKIGENTGDPVKMYLSDLYTTPANLAGIPALSFPVDFHDNLPVGMQLIGRSFDEALLLGRPTRINIPLRASGVHSFGSIKGLSSLVSGQ